MWLMGQQGDAEAVALTGKAMRLRVSQLVSVLRDEMERLTSESVDYSAGETSTWSHDLFGTGGVVSISQEYRDWLSSWQDWGETRGKREWIRSRQMEV